MIRLYISRGRFLPDLATIPFVEVRQIDQPRQWEEFLASSPWSPFLQSFAMGEVYRSIGEEPIRLAVMEGQKIVAICEAIIVPARRGRHLAVMYGPIIGECENTLRQSSGQAPIRKYENTEILRLMVNELKKIAKREQCVCIRMSPFWQKDDPKVTILRSLGFRSSPLHLLAEHIWYLDLRGKTEEQVLMGMRKTTRNLVRRAEREGVTVKVSENPVRDLPIFFALYEETRRRHHFVPYSKEFIRAQVEEFAKTNECRLYIASFNNEPVAASVHMVYAGETSYHHGASTTKYPDCYASYLLQWTAIRDALRRGDRVYNFWGISPENAKKHPFAGVRTFKTGFGGELIELMHCMDLPLSSSYLKTCVIETVRKWKRGF